MITRDEVLQIAKLAQLKLTEEEIALFQEQLGRILLCRP
jgi:Asp-tRNA(Asn)/Glu-tRNA(Gln) amidotransferase C subunit